MDTTPKGFPIRSDMFVLWERYKEFTDDKTGNFHFVYFVRYATGVPNGPYYNVGPPLAGLKLETHGLGVVCSQEMRVERVAAFVECRDFLLAKIRSGDLPIKAEGESVVYDSPVYA